MSNEVTARRKRKVRLLKLMLLQAAILSITACGGGGYGDNDQDPPPPPAPEIAEAQFTDEPIEGLGFRVADVVEGTTDAGGFQFAVGQPVQFFIGNGTDRLVIGTATPSAADVGAVSFSLQDLAEVQNDADQYLGNLLNLLAALDANSDLSDGIVIDAAAQAAVAAADETKSLDRVFLNDLVALDADRRGKEFLFVSRGANYVLRATVGEDGKLNILDDANKAARFQTGNLPSGVVMSRDGQRAYTNNELNTSITAIDLANGEVLARDIESSTPPAPGTVEHRRLFGKLAFFTALGVPDVIDEDGDGTYDVPLRDIDPLLHRNKASDNGWSSCASCHDDGHSDNVTWIFETGPRQTIQLEGMFARLDLNDQRILNWSAVRGSNTDFNNNARGIQGGKGFATDVRGVNRTAEVFNHGPVLGISDSLDAIQEWVTTVRAPIVPDLPAATEQAGRGVFVAQCAACHGGAKWTKSRTSPVFTNDPTFAEDPIGANFFVGVQPIDTGVTAAGPQIVSVTRDGKGTLTFLDNVGTFNAADPLELRGAAAVAGQSTQGFAAFGGAGFNSPSLLGLSLSAPYFHDGSAQTLDEVMKRHLLGNGQTVEQTLSAQELADLLAFVRSIDEQTATVESDTDRFLK